MLQTRPAVAPIALWLCPARCLWQQKAVSMYLYTAQCSFTSGLARMSLTWKQQCTDSQRPTPVNRAHGACRRCRCCLSFGCRCRSTWRCGRNNDTALQPALVLTAARVPVPQQLLPTLPTCCARQAMPPHGWRLQEPTLIATSARLDTEPPSHTRHRYTSKSTWHRSQWQHAMHMHCRTRYQHAPPAHVDRARATLHGAGNPVLLRVSICQ